MNILLQWATGLGKTKASLDYVKSYYKESKHIPTLLIIVAEIAHIQNWISEINKWKCKTVCKKATFICYASLKKYENTKWDFVILDECHHLFSEKRCNSFRSMTYSNIICLSATLKKNEVYMLQSDIKDLQLDVRTLKDSINKGKLVEPEIFIESVTLTKQETKEYQRICNRYNWAETCGYNKTKNLAGLRRKHLIGSAKTNALKGIVEKLRKEGTRFACYCTSIQQMVEVSGNINCVSSKHPKRFQTIEDFNEGKISEIFFCKMGTEGLNLSNIEAGIICQAEYSARQFIQKIGRVLRNKVNPKIYVIKAVSTIDEMWVQQCIQQIKE